MKFKKFLVLILIMFLVLALLFVILNKPLFTGESIKENKYSYTTALCNESNYCQDYQVTCVDNNAIEISPVTGAAIQKQEDWIDFRESKDLC